MVDYWVESEAQAVAGQAEVVSHCGWLREVRCVSNRHLMVPNVLGSLIAAGNSFQMVRVEKLKELLLKLVLQEGIRDRF